MLKVWIAGANGQIGRALNDVLDPMQIETLNTDLDELDITDTDEVINFGSINRPVSYTHLGLVNLLFRLQPSLCFFRLFPTVIEL